MKERRRMRSGRKLLSFLFPFLEIFGIEDDHIWMGHSELQVF